MKAELGTTGIALAMAILLCLLVGGGVAIYPGWVQAWKFMDENFLLSKEAPAWIQALGSIGALFIAIFVSRLDRKHALQLQVDAENQRKYIERKIVAASINRLGGAVSAATNRFLPGGSRSKWDIQLMRTLIAHEYEAAKLAPLQALDPEEQKLFFTISLLGMQLSEAMLQATEDEEISEQGEVLIPQESYDFLMKIIFSTRQKLEVTTKKLQLIWNQ